MANMKKPLDLEVLKRVTTLLEETPDVYSAAGDLVDMHGRVFRGRSIFGEESPLPMIAILEANDLADGDYADWARTIQHADWGLVIQGFVEDDTENPLDPAYMLKAAVQQQLSKIVALDSQRNRPPKPVYPDTYLLGQRPSGEPMITRFEVGKGVVRPPDAKVSLTSFFYLPVRVVLATDVSHPYLDS